VHTAAGTINATQERENMKHQLFSEGSPHEVLYHEGDQLRRLKGSVENLNDLGFVVIQGFNRVFYLNPDFVERIEIKEADQ